MSNQISASMDVAPAAASDFSAQKKADLWVLIGCLLCGTMIIGPFGTIPLIYGLMANWKLVKERRTDRPWSVVIVGTFSLIDATLNTLPWAANLLAFKSKLIESFMYGYGRIADGTYFLDYGSRAFGGVSSTAEIVWEITGETMLFPMRIVASVAFMSMRSWGLHFMKVTSWMYVFLWVGYAATLSLEFDQRLRPADLPVLGWWLYNMLYFTPMLTLPYFYTVSKARWNR